MELASAQRPVASSEQPTFDGLAARRRSSLPLLRTKAIRLPGSQATYTPPDTPTSIVSPSDDQQAPEPLFHNYLRAFHPFDPSPDDEASSITVPIKQGDLILVHSIHANGWADGTLLSSGARGWLPTNYCEAYDHPHMRNLLNAMTQFWDLLGDGENASFSTFVRQDYIRGLIAGVRCLLEHTDCLHRSASLVLRHVAVRRMRKGLLADLSSMVQKAKELQEEAAQPYAGEVVHIVLDELITKAFKVVTRAVRFVDIWLQDTIASADPSVSGLEPPTPPIDHDGEDSVGQLSVPSSPVKDRQFALEHNNFSTPRRTTEQDSAEQALGLPAPRRHSTLLVRGSTSSHRLSLVREDKRDGMMASEQLAQAHDECISLMGQFLGHHMQSRSPAELFDNTQRLVHACKRLTSIMDEVRPRDSGRVQSMHQSQLVFQSELADLVRSTREVFTFSDIPEDEVIILPEQIGRLVANGTRLIRAVGECVANTRRMLEKLGDFELLLPQIQPEDQNEEAPPPPLPKDNEPLIAASTKPLPPTYEKSLPEPPRPQPRLRATNPKPIETGLKSSAVNMVTQLTPDTPSVADPQMPLKLATRYHRQIPTPVSPTAVELPRSPIAMTFDTSSHVTSRARKDSVGTAITDASTTVASGLRDSETTVLSQTSTRATTPDRIHELPERKEIDPRMLSSFGSISSITSAATDASNDVDGALLHKTFAHELILNQQGQISGGSLHALIEQLTSHDSTPDPAFATTFYLTFRLFTDSRQLALALIERFDYIGDGKTVGVPVRLRICNFFKGWLESHWNAEADKDALGDVRFFALHKLKPVLPSAAERLLEATRKVTVAYQSGAPSPISIGRTMALLGGHVEDDSTAPEPIISKAQAMALRNANLSMTDCHILDMDPLETARQLTLITSRLYGCIQAEELLSLAWNKKGSSKALNVRSLCKLNTDLNYLVMDSIFTAEEVKKRALVIKHWTKVASHCLTLKNYESLLAIMAALMSSQISRLKKTWELVSKKSKARFEELKTVIDPSGNHASLRRKIDETMAPCVPFMGVYLTDLTFIDAGNPSTRPMANSSSANGDVVSVINFDKYTRIAKVVMQVQRFQVPYKLQVQSDLQTWLDAYLDRMREGGEEMERSFARRSNALEPRQSVAAAFVAAAPIKITDNGKRHAEAGAMDDRPKTASADSRRADAGVKDQFSFFMKHNAFGFKSKVDLSIPVPPLPQQEQHDTVEGASRPE